MPPRRKHKPKPAWRPPELTEADILRWADAYHAATGEWPTKRLGRQVIPGTNGERWSAVDIALSKGNRGLPGGSSLPRLLAEHRGVRNRKGLKRLTYPQILKWADAYHARTGEWPTQTLTARDIPESPGDGWQHIDDAMRRGLRGLPGSYSLARLLADRRGVRNRAGLPPLTEEQILQWADAFHERTGRWPGQRVWRESIPDSGGETWLTVDQALKIGIRGLPAGRTLADLLADTGRARNPAKLPPLTEQQIVGWASAHHARHGRWPTTHGTLQEIDGSFGERWANIDQALRKGLRGLPGGSSISRLLKAVR